MPSFLFPRPNIFFCENPLYGTILVIHHNGTTTPLSQAVLYAKDTAAESMGVMGHYAEITLTLPNTVTGPSELFAIESETMKSYP